MLWRHLGLARATSAAGLLTTLMIGISAAGEPREPVPGDEAQSETVKVLDAEKAGRLAVEVRGHGQDRVRVTLKNTSDRRLNVVLPPGLVASSATGQGAGGAGFQSMGLGAATNRSGGFGQFAGNDAQPGFRSVPPADGDKPAVTVPPGQKVDLEIPAVCLNFGLPTPTLKNKFRLVDVDDYSKDARVRKALRALATLGTSQGTAQAVMWRVCNNVPFEQMLARGDNSVNLNEVGLASRFLDALDQSADAVEPAYLTEARLFVTIEAEGPLAKDAKKLSSSIEGLRILGLPARVTPSGEMPRAVAPALHLGVRLSAGPAGTVRGQVAVKVVSGPGEAVEWTSLGQVSFKDSTSFVLDGASFARTLDHAVGSAFVSARVSRRSTGSTTLKIENRLPFTLANVTVKAGNSSGAPMLTIPALGIGPGRTGLATIPAPSGTVDRVELNGL